MESGANDCMGNESLPEVVDGEEMVNELELELDESEPIDDDETEIDFEAYGDMNESDLNEPGFEFVFKNEPEVVSHDVTPIVIDELEKYVVCVSVDGVVTFEKITEQAVEQPGENNTEPSENEDGVGHFDTETKEAEENTFEESSKPLIESEQEAKEISVKHGESSPNKSDEIPDKTTFENDKLSLSAKTVTHGKQGTKIISANHVEDCSDEFDEKLARRAVVVLEKCALSSSPETPEKVCETNRVTKPGGKHFLVQTNKESQRKVARMIQIKSRSSVSAVKGRNSRRIRRKADDQVAESSSCNDKTTAKRRKNRDERGLVQKKPIAIERLRKPRAFLSLSGTLNNSEIAKSSSLRQGDEQSSLETCGISLKELTPEKQTPEKLKLGNEMTKQRQKFTLSVKRLRQLPNFPSSSDASKINCEVDEEKVECVKHLSLGNNKENPEKLRAGARNLRRSRRQETAKQLEESSSSYEKENGNSQRKPIGVEGGRKPCTFLFLSGAAKKDESSLSLQQEDEHLSPETGRGSRKKLRTESKNLRRSRRNDTAQQRDKSSSSDENGKRIVTRLRKPLTFSYSHCKIGDENNLSPVVRCEKLSLAETIKENQEKVGDEVRNLRQFSRRKETPKQLEKRSLSDDNERKLTGAKNGPKLRTLPSLAKNHCKIKGENNLSLVVKCEKLLLPELRNESQEEVRAEAKNVGRRRGNEIVKQFEKTSTSEAEEKRTLKKPIVVERSKVVRAVPSLSRDSKKNYGNVVNSILLQQSDEQFSPKTAKERPKKLRAEAGNLRRSKRSETVKQPEEDDDDERRLARNKGFVVERQTSLSAAHMQNYRKMTNSETDNGDSHLFAVEGEENFPSETIKEKITETSKKFGLAATSKSLNRKCKQLEVARRREDADERTRRNRAKVSKNFNCNISDEKDDEDENSLPLAVACEEHFLPKVSKENPKKLAKCEVSLRKLKLFRAVNNTSKLEEYSSAVNEGKRAQVISLSHNNNYKIDAVNNITLEVEYENGQEKPGAIHETFESNLSDDARRKGSSDDECFTSDEEVKRKLCALPSVKETPKKILNEQSYSLEQPETESVKQPEVTETLKQFEECYVSVGEEVVVETSSTILALPSVSESPMPSYCRIYEEHCYSLDKRKINNTPELTELETLQMTTEAIEQGVNREFSNEVLRAKLKRSNELCEELEKRLEYKRQKLRRANETRLEREKLLERNRASHRKQRERDHEKTRHAEVNKCRERLTKEDAAVQQGQGTCNESPSLDSNSLNAPSEDGTQVICSNSHDTNDKVVMETLDSNCVKSLDPTDEDGRLSICLNSCDTNDEVSTGTPCINNNNLAATISDDYIYNDGDDITNEDETLTDSNSGDGDNGLAITDVDTLSNAQTFSIVANEDGDETLTDLSSSIVVNGDVIYAFSTASNDEEQATGTAPNTFYVMNEDGTSSEIVVYIDGGDT